VTRLNDCHLWPARVSQMQVGDRVGAPLDALWANVQGTLFLSALARVAQVHGGALIVEKKADGYHVDLSRVPKGHRFQRKSSWSGKVYRVKGITGDGARGG